MLIAQSVFSQTGYQVIKGDTVVSLTIGQVRQINAIIIDLDECQEVRDSLRGQIRLFKQLSFAQGETILSLDDQVLQLKEIGVADRLIIKSVEGSMEKERRKKKFLIIGGVILAGLLIAK
jgi:hypothetical protein